MDMVVWFYAANNNYKLTEARKTADNFSFELGYQHLWRCCPARHPPNNVCRREVHFTNVD